MNPTPHVEPVNGAAAPTESLGRGGWLCFRRSAEARELLRRDPLAFAPLALVALRARWNPAFTLDSLEVGQALVGDHEECGLTRREYRTRLLHLEKGGFLTTKATKRGTIATLTNRAIFDILPLDGGHHNDRGAAISRPLTIRKKEKHPIKERAGVVALLPAHTPLGTWVWRRRNRMKHSSLNSAPKTLI